jgi:hypothetical protein
MEIYLNILWIVPLIVWITTRKISQILRCTLVGVSFGLIVPYASVGLYALYFVWPVSEAFGQFCFYLSFLHDLAGIRVAIILQLVSAHSPIADDQRFLIEVVNAVSWAICYGALGLVWGILRYRRRISIKIPKTSRPE